MTPGIKTFEGKAYFDSDTVWESYGLRTDVNENYRGADLPNADSVVMLRAAEWARVEKLLESLVRTADGAFVLECDKLYCPKCGGEVRQEFDVCYCDECVNPDDGGCPNWPPLPLFYESCLSKPPKAGP